MPAIRKFPENVAQLKQIIGKLARLRPIHQTPKQARDLVADRLNRLGGVHDVITARRAGGASEIGLAYSLKKRYRFLFEPVQIPPMAGTGHTGFHRCVQQDNVIRAHRALHQTFQ
jgi:hypothetical protein